MKFLEKSSTLLHNLWLNSEASVPGFWGSDSVGWKGSSEQVGPSLRRKQPAADLLCEAVSPGLFPRERGKLEANSTHIYVRQAPLGLERQSTRRSGQHQTTPPKQSWPRAGYAVGLFPCRPGFRGALQVQEASGVQKREGASQNESPWRGQGLPSTAPSSWSPTWVSTKQTLTPLPGGGEERNML